MAFGFSVPRGSADALMPEQFVQEIYDGVEQGSIILDKMTRMPNMSRLQERMAVLDLLPQAFFVNGDDGLRQTTTMRWRNKYLEAQEVSVIVPIPQTVIDDSGYPIWPQVMPKIRQAIAQVVDQAILIGTNAPALWPSSMKAQAIAAGQTLSYAGSGAANYYQALAGVNGTFSQIELAGYDPSGGVGSMAFKAALRGMVDTQQRPLLLGQDQPVSQMGMGLSGFQVAGLPFSFAKNAAFANSDMLALVGDFKEAIWALRQDLNFRVVVDGVINDSNGNIVYNLTQQRMAAILLWVRLAWQVPNPPNLFKGAATVDANDNNTTRSPFAVLTV